MNVGSAVVHFVVGGAISIAWMVWHTRASNATYRERMEIIAAIDEAGWPAVLERQYRFVDYNAHLRAKFWGRDAIELYPRQLREVIRAYRGEVA